MEQHMEFQEYPKALYLAGQQMLVDDAEQEDAARADGYDDWHTDHARSSGTDDGHVELIKKPIESDFAAPADEQPAELDREALKARATELGLAFGKTISTEKLAALVAAAE